MRLTLESVVCDVVSGPSVDNIYECNGSVIETTLEYHDRSQSWQPDDVNKSGCLAFSSPVENYW